MLPNLVTMLPNLVTIPKMLPNLVTIPKTIHMKEDLFTHSQLTRGASHLKQISSQFQAASTVDTAVRYRWHVN